jgi:hypothetical protein
MGGGGVERDIVNSLRPAWEGGGVVRGQCEFKLCFPIDVADPLHLLHVKNQEIAQLKLRIQQEQEIVAHVQMSQVINNAKQVQIPR